MDRSNIRAWLIQDTAGISLHSPETSVMLRRPATPARHPHIKFKEVFRTSHEQNTVRTFTRTNMLNYSFTKPERSVWLRVHRIFMSVKCRKFSVPVVLSRVQHSMTTLENLCQTVYSMLVRVAKREVRSLSCAAEEHSKNHRATGLRRRV